MIEVGDFVWYRKLVHVALSVLPNRVELIRFGDKTKTTFWVYKPLVRPLSKEDIQRLTDAH